MKTMKKKLAVALTVALLALPLSTVITLADTAIPISTTTTPDTTTTTPDATTPDTTTTTPDTTTPDTTTTTPDTTTPDTTTTTPDATTPDTTTTTPDDTTTPVVDANGNTVTPDNWLTDLIGKLKLALTFDPVRKAELSEQQALSKLAEAQQLMEDGKADDAQVYLNEYTDKIAKAQAFLDQVEDPTSEAAITLAKALANVNSNNVQVLGNLLDKLPPQAAQKIALNVVRSMEKAVAKIQKAEANSATETTPTVTPVVDNKSLEKQARVALENFKKSLKQKGKIHIEDQDQQDNEDKDVVVQSKPGSQSSQTQSITQGQPTNVTVAPDKQRTSPNVKQAAEQGKEDRNIRAENGKNKGSDKEGNHQDN